MDTLHRVVLASSNQGKLREFSSLLAPLGYTVIPQNALGISSIAEPHATFVENALAKARHASILSGLPTLADDSGLCVKALGGAPGVRSARFAAETATDIDNNQFLLEQMKDYSDRSAYFYSVVVFMFSAYHPEPIICCGYWHGEIAQSAINGGGFGYDAVFIDPLQRKHVSELKIEDKNKVSHRAQALKALLIELERRGGF